MHASTNLLLNKLGAHVGHLLLHCCHLCKVANVSTLFQRFKRTDTCCGVMRFICSMAIRISSGLFMIAVRDLGLRSKE